MCLLDKYKYIDICDNKLYNNYDKIKYEEWFTFVIWLCHLIQRNWAWIKGCKIKYSHLKKDVIKDGF